MLNNRPRSIAILGAGITGLTAAHRLTQRGHRVRVFESSDRIGGAIRTEMIDGWLIEAGPNSLLAGDPPLAALLVELGLEGERVAANPAAKNRYIVRRGRPLAAPLSPAALLRSSLFSPGAKLRVMLELFSRRRARTIDLSLEEFIRDHFGSELVDYGLNPLVAGVYAGNPRKLSARHAFPKLWTMERSHGSLLRGLRAAAQARRLAGAPESSLISFRHGLQSLPHALAAHLAPGSLTLRARVEALIPGPPANGSVAASAPPEGPAKAGGTWNLVWSDGGPAKTESFDAIIAALPAPALAQLRFGTLGEQPLASLEAIEHPPVSSMFLGYRREDVSHPLDGFGLLVPEKERRALLGVLFSSSLFSGRAPEGFVALTVLVGGTRQPEIARLPTDELLAAVERDLRELLGVRGAPVFQRRHFWPRAIPQYNLGYEVHLETMAATERTHPGFFIGGQARDGIALPACVAAGEKLAARVVS